MVGCATRRTTVTTVGGRAPGLRWRMKGSRSRAGDSWDAERRRIDRRCLLQQKRQHGSKDWEKGEFHGCSEFEGELKEVKSVGREDEKMKECMETTRQSTIR